MTLVLGADVGGTHLRLAMIGINGEIRGETKIRASISASRHQSARQAEQHVLDTLAEAMLPLIRTHAVTAVGIGFPGFFIGGSGILAASPNLPDLRDFRLAEALSQRLDLPVAAQNDALCAAIGEHAFGAGRGASSLLHITLGTGVGGGLILDGLPYTGEHGMAMELGHLRVCHDETSRPCGCGGRGCVEAYASATAVAARYREATGRQLDSAGVHAAALRGDATAMRMIGEAGLYLGRALAEAIKLLDIATITVSGGLTGAWEFLYPELARETDRLLIAPLRDRIRIRRSALTDHAGLLGAASLAHRLQEKA